jgi:DNA-binding transcriptional LysR family regulator
MDFVGFDRSDLIIRMMAQMGIKRRRENFPIRCDDQLVYWQMVRSGLGIGGMQTMVGDADPAVTRIAPFIPMPALPVWLTAPEALRQTPRIRAVLDHLAQAFRTLPA